MAEVKANGNGKKNGDRRRAAIDAAVEVLARLVQEHEAVDHCRILVAIDSLDLRVEITKLSKRRLT